MSDTASLELSRELYELSGWDNRSMVGHTLHGLAFTDEEEDFICPAYDAGYLLRKLPIYVDIEKQANWSDEPQETGLYRANHHASGKHSKEFNSPEDALAELCIVLIKKGILPISGRD